VDRNANITVNWADALWVRKYLNKMRFLAGLRCSVVESALFIDGKIHRRT